ncbi:hypothetical protein IQ06DRAFT_291148 [Phaeosphaeriaceae sp. SRC1lsM3a]|nr:hypothetical protein IQ06DRAFT_291148 [Stagonospora sp. SRC1lsM3a]
MASSVSLFSAPRSCSTTWAGTGGEISVGVRCSSGTLIDDTECLPPATATITGCPVDWRAVTTANSITTCCPNEFPIHSNGGVCYSSAGGFILSGITCNPTVSPTNVQKTYGFTPGVWAKAVSYVGTSTPTPTSSPTRSTISSSATASNTITSSPSLSSPKSPASSSTATTSLRSRKKKLGGGAIAGIIIGAILAVAIILTVIFMLRKRRQRTKDTTQIHTIPEHSYAYSVEKSELEAASRAELDAASKAHIQPSSHPRTNAVELSAHDTTPHTHYK